MLENAFNFMCQHGLHLWNTKLILFSDSERAMHCCFQGPEENREGKVK